MILNTRNMIKQRLILAFLLCIIATSGAFAQLSKMKRARMFMDQLNYMGAIELYNQILEKGDNPEAKINIAEAYRKISDSESAEYWYGQVVQLPEAEPVHKLFYGQMLQRNGKCDLAKEWYMAYVEAVPGDQRGQYLVQACDYEDELRTKNAGIYQITDVDFNSELDDFAPAYFGDGLVFASERDPGTAVKRLHCWTGNPFNELFQVKRKKAEGEEGKQGMFNYDRPEKYSKELNSKFHDAVVTFNADQSMIYFTRNNLLNGKTGKDDDGTIRLKVYSATVDGENWKDIQGLPFNSDEYSVAHPTLTPDGNTMYFTSDMPGGFGGMDLYKTTKEGSSWGPPENLGPRINTEGNEIFPYYNRDKKLYFSSDGQVGLGGLDIYHMQDQGEGSFGDITNMGYPLNTISDDFGIIFEEDGKAGYFTSDREGGKGRDDIYAFLKSAAEMEILVYDEETKEPIEGASVVNDCTGNTMVTDAEGKIRFDMKLDQCCNFSASAETYVDNEKQGCTRDAEIGSKVFVEIPLSKDNPYLLEGIVFDQTTGRPIEGALVELTSSCEDEEAKTVTTGEDGAFSWPVTEGCCYSVKGTKEGYFGNPMKDLCANDPEVTLQALIYLNPTTGPAIVENTNPVNPVTTPRTGIAIVDGKYVDLETGERYTGDYNGVPVVDGNLQGGASSSITYENPGTTYDDNIPGYLLHIYYDFDQSYIREEASPELQKLCAMMKENTDLIVEIASHTDSRGSFRYNSSLSQRRAESVVRWLEDCGISRDRLVPRGYGETKNVNNCANAIPCSEREHQMNRRTEFRVIGCVSCASEEKLSQPKSNPRLDECQGCPF